MNTKTLFFITGALSIVVMYLLGTRLTSRMAIDYTQSDGSAAQPLIPDTSDVDITTGIATSGTKPPRPGGGISNYSTATPTVIPGATR